MRSDRRRSEAEFDLADIARRLANVVREGVVAELDAPAQRVRVRYDRDEVGAPILTAWRPWLTFRAGEDRTWWAPDLGEQVVLLSPSGELPQALVLPALYRDAHPAPSANPELHRTRYRDGAVFDYDRENHRYSITLPEDGEMVVTIGDTFLKLNKDLIQGHAGARAGDVRWNA